MVALAVVALALPALLLTLDRQIDATAYLRDKSIAHAVAANKLAEIRILARARQELFKGRESGITRMGERDWYWQIDSQPTEVPLFQRLQIDVAMEESDAGQPVYTLVAYLPADLASQPEAEVESN